jgi:hypothetical protein
LTKASKVIVVERPIWDRLESGERERVPLAPVIEGIREMAFIRNEVGAHFNPGGAEFPEEDARLFARHTVTLIRTLVCRGCGSIAAREKDGCFRCECGATHMLPSRV